MRRLAVAALVLAASSAHAEPRASAVQLFAHGRALAAEGKCAEAVPFFLDTLKLDASIGALLNLAECEETLHEAPQAYARFREAEALARQKSDDREGLARARADRLAPHVPRVTITAPAYVRVTLDGHAALAGENVVSEGEHAVRASADGKRTWETTIHATPGRAEPVVVPELEPLAITKPLAPRPSARRTAGIVVTITGAVTLATAGVFGGLALAKKNDEVALSTGPSQAAFDDAKSAAHTFGDASTVLFVAGGVVAAAGIIVWLTAPRSPVTLGARTLTVAF